MDREGPGRPRHQAILSRLQICEQSCRGYCRPASELRRSQKGAGGSHSRALLTFLVHEVAVSTQAGVACWAAGECWERAPWRRQYIVLMKHPPEGPMCRRTQENQCTQATRSSASSPQPPAPIICIPHVSGVNAFWLLSVCG